LEWSYERWKKMRSKDDRGYEHYMEHTHPLIEKLRVL
jgi:hypothetical protein